MKTINLKEVAQKILEKQPYKIINEEKTNKPATEQTSFVDVLTFSVNRVGADFKNIPFDISKTAYGVERKHVALIGADGEILEEIRCSEYSSSWNSDEFNRERRDFKFSSNKNELVFALKLTDVNYKGSEKNYLLFLSKPMTIAQMQEKETLIIKIKRLQELQRV